MEKETSTLTPALEQFYAHLPLHAMLKEVIQHKAPDFVTRKIYRGDQRFLPMELHEVSIPYLSHLLSLNANRMAHILTAFREQLHPYLEIYVRHIILLPLLATGQRRMAGKLLTHKYFPSLRTLVFFLSLPRIKRGKDSHLDVMNHLTHWMTDLAMNPIPGVPRETLPTRCYYLSRSSINEEGWKRLVMAHEAGMDCLGDWIDRLD